MRACVKSYRSNANIIYNFCNTPAYFGECRVIDRNITGIIVALAVLSARGRGRARLCRKIIFLDLRRCPIV